MTSGTKRHWRLSAALACALMTAAPAWALELPELMGLLAQNKSGEARFVEKRQVQGLARPLQSSGTLSFVAPGRFARQTLEPRPEAMVVDGDQVSLTRNGRTRQMALDAVPEMALMVKAIRGTLTGDGATLRQAFRLTLLGNAAQWTLQMEPQDARLAAQISYIMVSGRRGEVRGMEMQMADGDRSVTTIEPLPAGGSAAAASSP
jgi:outer membrane lipoprotein-sorting protein